MHRDSVPVKLRWRKNSSILLFVFFHFESRIELARGLSLSYGALGWFARRSFVARNSDAGVQKFIAPGRFANHTAGRSPPDFARDRDDRMAPPYAFVGRQESQFPPNRHFLFLPRARQRGTPAWQSDGHAKAPEKWGRSSGRCGAESPSASKNAAFGCRLAIRYIIR